MQIRTAQTPPTVADACSSEPIVLRWHQNAEKKVLTLTDKVSFVGLHSTGSMYTSYPLSPSRSTSAQVAPGINAHRTTSYSSAAPTSAPASPTRIDGKEFFRQAR